VQHEKNTFHFSSLSTNFSKNLANQGGDSERQSLVNSVNSGILGGVMKAIVNEMKHMFLDLIAMGKGFIYGFVMVALIILVSGALLYGMLYLRNIFI
jgi:hypothetical protein